MRHVAGAVLAVGLAWGALSMPTAARPPADIDTMGPPPGVGAAWTAERMRDARERLKDIIPR